MAALMRFVAAAETSGLGTERASKTPFGHARLAQFPLPHRARARCGLSIRRSPGVGVELASRLSYFV